MTDPKVVLVAGGRDLKDKHLVSTVLSNIDIGEIVQGGAKGADALGKQHAEYTGCSIKEFPANWEEYGKSAGPIRNRQMADYLLEQRDLGMDVRAEIFWDGVSKGTWSMINILLKSKIDTNITFYGRNEEK